MSSHKILPAGEWGPKNYKKMDTHIKANGPESFTKSMKYKIKIKMIKKILSKLKKQQRNVELFCF